MYRKRGYKSPVVQVVNIFLQNIMTVSSGETDNFGMYNKEAWDNVN